MTVPRQAPASDSAAAVVENLTVTTADGRVPIVEGVSFAVAEGEVLGLVGESGSGKTTVGLALLGHTRPGLVIKSGGINVGSTEVLGLQPRALREFRKTAVAFVPQDPASSLNPALKLKAQFGEIFLGSPLNPAQIEQAIETAIAGAGLRDWRSLRSKYPHQLSGGQQQRLVIAMAFARHPRLIILDEPTTGVDVSTQRRILETIRDLCSRERVAAVYITHDLDVVRSLAHRVCVMYSGRVVEMGTTEEIFTTPAHPYTRGLLRAIPSLSDLALPHGIPGQPDPPGGRPAGCAFAERCDLVIDDCRLRVPDPVVVNPVTGHSARCIRTAEVTELALRTGRQASGLAGAAAARSSLVVAGLRAGYGGTEVLSGVSVRVDRGECVALVGESGSGKTTLARCVVGLIPWSSGSVSMGDESLAPGLARRSDVAIRRMQYVFQNPYGSLNPRRTVAHLLEQPLRLLCPEVTKRQRAERIDAALAEVALSGRHRHRRPHQLSGGERQRVAIARALITDPWFLVCDEVTSSLDVSVQASIMELLDRLRTERALGVLLITHNLALTRSTCQRIVLLKEGVVQEEGPVEQVLVHPASGYGARLLADMPRPGSVAASGAAAEPVTGAAGS